MTFTRGALDLEFWLLSPAQRVALIAVLVLVACSASTWQLYEVVSSRRDSVDVAPIFFGQLALWSSWALIGYPLVAMALWVGGRLRYWPMFLLMQVPLCLAVSYGFARLEPVLLESVFSDRGGERSGSSRRSEAREGEERSERDRLPTDRGRRPGGRRSSTVWRMPRQVLTYWVVLALGAGMAAFLRTRAQERRAAELELRTAKLRAELAEVQIDTLRKELNPHFLFNALHTVGGLVRSGDSAASLKVLAGIGDLLRTTLDQGESQLVRLRDELQLARRYLEIEGIRFGERLSVEVQAPEAVLDAAVPSLLLLPIVENAVKYAVEPRAEGGRITVEALRDGEELVVRVTDDGPGFPESVRGAGTVAGGGRNHIGLTNVRRRLEMLYGGEDRARLENLDPGARVTLSIPWTEDLEHTNGSGAA